MMQRFIPFLRRPVKRQGAEQYLLITLLSFALSVILTRLFLQITGYPQLGGGGLHIAHVLWGGLLLFVAALLPLLVANRWAFSFSAFFAGVGVGLFIDEVGKFITQSNNYFYPLAAPLIYAFFLLTVLLYLRIRRPPSRSARAELYRAFDALEEVLEHDLDPQEHEELEASLRHIVETSQEPDLARLATDLLDFLASDALKLTPRRYTLWERLQNWWQPLEKRYVSPVRLRAVIAGALLALGLTALTTMLQALPVAPLNHSLNRLLGQFVDQGQIQSAAGLNWFFARLALETSVGLLLLSSSGLVISGKIELGVWVGIVALLLSLTTVDLLVFYFDQFSTVITASVQFSVLLLLTYYRQRYLVKPRG